MKIMDSKSEFENKIINEIKELIISDSSLTYGERNSFDRFILRINQNKTFEDAVGQLLRNLERLESKEIQPLGLTAGSKKIFNQLSGRYDVAKKKEVFIFYGGALMRRRSTASWAWTMLFLIIIVILMVTGKLNFFFEFTEKYLN